MPTQTQDTASTSCWIWKSYCRVCPLITYIHILPTRLHSHSRTSAFSSNYSGKIKVQAFVICIMCKSGCGSEVTPDDPESNETKEKSSSTQLQCTMVIRGGMIPIDTFTPTAGEQEAHCCQWSITILKSCRRTIARSSYSGGRKCSVIKA